MNIKDLLKKVRQIELKTKGLSEETFSGQYKTLYKGRGMSFSEVRPYQYGDDIRNIDWNVTARMNEPHIKVFDAERERTFMILIDLSASSMFGTTAENKREFMAEVAATLAFSAKANNDKVGALFFATKVEYYLPPQKGRKHILHMIRQTLSLEVKNTNTNLNAPLKYLTNLINRRCTAFLLSDFIATDYSSTLKIAAKRHDVIGIHIYDPRELELPDMGILPMVDAETGQLRWIDTSATAVRETYTKRFTQNLEQFHSSFRKFGADSLSICTEESFVKELIKFFRGRGIIR